MKKFCCYFNIRVSGIGNQPDIRFSAKFYFIFVVVVDLPSFDQTMSKSNDDIVANIKSSRFVVSTDARLRMIIE